MKLAHNPLVAVGGPEAVAVDGQSLYLYNLGITCIELGRLEEAETALSRSFALSPRDYEIATELATVQFNRHRIDEARRTLENFLAKSPDHPRSQETKTRLRSLERQAGGPQSRS